MPFYRIKLKIFYCYYFFLLFKSFSCFIVFPFKTVFQDFDGINQGSIEYNYSHFFKESINQLIYTKIKIGEPPQEVNTFITFNDCNFKIGKARKCINSPEYLSLYNRNYSNDFNYTDFYPSPLSEFEGYKGHSAEETIYAYTDLNLKNYEKFTNIGFYLGSDTNDSLCGIIGLKMLNYAQFCSKSNNILKSFKSRNIINNNKWILNYTFKDEGLFIIGANISELIHNFNEDNLYTVLLTMGGSNFPWMILISKIEYNENDDINKYNVETKAEINNDYSLIIGGFSYNSYIEDNYFNKYLKLNICSKNLVTNIEDNFKYYIYECDKNFTKDDIQKFPKLSFIIRCYENILKVSLDGKDLFTETKYKYFFNIIFSNSWKERWVLGKPFLKKYPTIIDLESKIIQIYNNSYKDENEKKEGNEGNERNKGNHQNDGENKISSKFIFLMVGIILVLIFIFSILGYYLGKNLNKIRKKKVNELVDEDAYDYNSDENKDNKPINF